MGVKQSFMLASLLMMGVSINFLFQNCSGPAAAFSHTEDSVLSSNPFQYNYGDSNGAMDQVYSDYDAIPINPYVDSPDWFDTRVADCAQPGRYDQERELAVEEAKADASGKTVPVQYSYSFGDKHDIIAKYANSRAVLSKANPGHSNIPVGGKAASNHKGKHFYYKANHDKAKDQYLKGERCFFSTISINKDSGASSSTYYDFITESDKSIRHKVHYMYFGYCAKGRCRDDATFAGDYANRLFDEVPSFDDGAPQIIKLYMADFRSQHFGFDVMRVGSSLTRGEELNANVSEFLDMQVLHENFFEIRQNLSLGLDVNDITFHPMIGLTQILNNLMIFNINITVIALQYTPLVLDLGEKGIRTSSSRWGTYFNMAGLENLDLQQEDLNRWAVPHRTAWLGGVYKHFTPADAPEDMEQDIRLIAEDGFMVIPDSDGKVRSSRNMFGDNMDVDGNFYENGFKALQALAKKYCSSDEITDRYFGPWDGETFQRVKVWIDGNRNGVVNDGELHSLSAAGVLAINTCNTIHKDNKDSFGNGTALRSTFLMKERREGMVSDDEIIARLHSGMSSPGHPANFRLVIDIIFQTNEELLLTPMNVGRVSN